MGTVWVWFDHIWLMWNKLFNSGSVCSCVMFTLHEILICKTACFLNSCTSNGNIPASLRSAWHHGPPPLLTAPPNGRWQRYWIKSSFLTYKVSYYCIFRFPRIHLIHWIFKPVVSACDSVWRWRRNLEPWAAAESHIIVMRIIYSLTLHIFVCG